MRSLPGLAAVAALLALAVFPSVGGDAESEKVELTGYFTDEWCGKSNANPEGAECARRCADKGSAMAFWDGKELYTIRKEDKQKAVEHVGVEVVVTFRWKKNGTLEIVNVKKAAKG